MRCDFRYSLLCSVLLEFVLSVIIFFIDSIHVVNVCRARGSPLVFSIFCLFYTCSFFWFCDRVRALLFLDLNLSFVLIFFYAYLSFDSSLILRRMYLVGAFRFFFCSSSLLLPRHKLTGNFY